MYSECNYFARFSHVPLGAGEKYNTKSSQHIDLNKILQKMSQHSLIWRFYEILEMRIKVSQYVTIYQFSIGVMFLFIAYFTEFWI